MTYPFWSEQPFIPILPASGSLRCPKASVAVIDAQMEGEPFWGLDRSAGSSSDEQSDSNEVPELLRGASCSKAIQPRNGSLSFAESTFDARPGGSCPPGLEHSHSKECHHHPPP
jgi:hypothetical protein